MHMTFPELKAWRAAQRKALILARMALAPDMLESFRIKIDTALLRSFPGLASSRLALCWPIKNEYDARHVAKTLRERGATTALPVVVAPKQPLAFREWHPGVELARGVMDIPYPVSSPEVTPSAVLLPMNGWDRQGYRLGYGGGFFDRTLAALASRPVVVGVTYELAAMETIHPQEWDIPVDYVVTERGVYRRDPDGLVFLGMPEPSGPDGVSSPVCYADEAYYTRNSR